ncbi:hypothetical protein BDQ12DRAFT_730668 [Crucibulum laeve]|uniref:Shelterin complex subunit TPP1/Est3 domain-containing protein n=1 Tax=Crucibulum laeve TaxID=68775 RepID=A0A5C3MIW1_9AGAR|nr:hypothetical protein BDQ12DRAFT_730668 [Crucibulum laeve]
MSDSLLPWIADYLIDIGEKHGSNLLEVQPTLKGKKVQITEFLTYGSETEYVAIWGRVSDKQHLIPVKFTKEAVEQYSNITGKRLTQLKTAIVQIKRFKPFFTRIPLNKRMSTHYQLALECNSVSLIGSISEAMFGNPKPIDTHPALKDWSEGLVKDGGAGNILRDRRLEREAAAAPNAVASTSTIPEQQILVVLPPKPERKKPSTPVPVDITRQFQRIMGDRAYWRAPPDAQQTLETIPDPPEYEEQPAHPQHTSPPTKLSPARLAQPHSPQSYSPAHSPRLESPRRISPRAETPPRKRSRIIDPLDLDSEPEDNEQDVEIGALESSPERMISDWAPTPSRQSSVPPHESPPPEEPEPSTSIKKTPISPYIDSSHIRPPTPAQRIRSQILPLSSPLPISSMVASETILTSQEVSIDPVSHPRHAVTRKIPRPRSPSSLRNDGPARILVPNSDTSLSYSQSQSQSQSQPSQPVVLSQLASLSKGKEENQLHTDSKYQAISASPNSTYDGDQSSPERSSSGGKKEKKQKGNQKRGAGSDVSRGNKRSVIRSLSLPQEVDESQRRTHVELFGATQAEDRGQNVRQGPRGCGSAHGKGDSRQKHDSEYDPDNQEADESMGYNAVAWAEPAFLRSAKRRRTEESEAAAKPRLLGGYSVNMDALLTTTDTGVDSSTPDESTSSKTIVKAWVGWGRLLEILEACERTVEERQQELHKSVT